MDDEDLTGPNTPSQIEQGAAHRSYGSTTEAPVKKSIGCIYVLKVGWHSG